MEDLQRLAARRLPRPVLDYIDGGADTELSLAGNAAAFERYRFTPRVLADVSVPDTTTTALGRPATLPLGLAPTGYTRMVNPAGEAAVAGAAAQAGIPYVLSTMATTSLEDLAALPAVAPADRWFQLYVWKDRGRTLDLVRRAADAGYRVLEVAVDTAVPGNRLRDLRNGFTIPPRLTASSLLDIGSKPGYWTRMLRAPDLEFANVSGGPAGYTIENIGSQFDPSLTWRELAELREAWNGKLLVKGPVGPADARRARELGADGVHLSNHGGRQLDRTVAPVDLVAGVRVAAGEDFTIVVDSGIRHGADIAVALAHGADLAMVGRPYLWALAAGGEAGVARLIELLASQFRRTMALLGVASAAELRRRGPELLAAGPAAGPAGTADPELSTADKASIVSEATVRETAARGAALRELTVDKAPAPETAPSHP
ncbi:L-lactate dehydrogenase [Arthrobacter crystallopoietes BAB-32]|uniref:L-lactate dehydrogenase n=1 Tax=Arthrobacter crystallopoietes BAB-32 TaxID=1246476 RepID=N1UWT8_9MICC|nr:alpha-hydroxy acid oxidase [Arthrobacter crystallopoietes]EMY32224.1 L-lactate dehydrogenase [Arthrobacter crystallopoietes BAB-32]